MFLVSRKFFVIMTSFLSEKIWFEEISLLVWNYLVKAENWVYCQLRIFPFFMQKRFEKIAWIQFDSIPSPSPSVKIQIIGGKVYLRVIRQNIAGWCQQNFVFKSFLTTPSIVLPLHFKQTFPPIIWIFTEGDGVKTRLPF